MKRPSNWKTILGCVLTLAAASAAGPARANDSSASLDTGGIVFTYNSAITMQDEDLFLSQDAVRVRYKFLNTSAVDITTLVAFPLPEIETGEAGNYGVESSDPINFIDFKVSVDGKAIDPQVEAKAISLGVDISAILAKYGLPLTTITGSDAQREALNAKFRTLSPDALTELTRYGAISRESSSSPDGARDVDPTWAARITFYWFQTFPAGRAIEVTHSYRPVPRTFFTSETEIGSARMKKDYCVDSRAIAAARTFGIGGTPQGVELRYILSTAQHWLGPIGHFRVTVDKGSPNRVASTCFQGLKQVGPTTFMAEKSNFQPTEELNVLLLEKIAVD